VTHPARPSLLFLSQTLPYPPDGGVKIRTFHVLRLLAASFDVTALCFYRSKRGRAHQDVEGAVRALNRLARVEAFPIPQEHSRGRLMWDHMRSLLTRHVYTNYVFESSEFRRRLGALLAARSFDLVHIDSLDLSGYLPMLEGLPVVCVHHDAQSVLLQRRAEHEDAAWRRAYVRYQATLMAREEQWACERVALNVTVSEIDRGTLVARAPRGRFVAIQNGVDLDAFRPAAGRDEGILFVGGTTWLPNRDAMNHFCNDILPLIRGAGERASVRWVGRALEEEKKHYQRRYGVELTGYVTDTRPYVQDAACCVVPLRVGGGTRIKILDAWAMGKAVVSTSIGCEGLAAVDGQNILIRDTPAAFAAAVCAVLGDGDLRQRLGRGGRTTVEQQYGWEAIGAGMVSEYQALLEPARGRPVAVHA